MRQTRPQTLPHRAHVLCPELCGSGEDLGSDEGAQVRHQDGDGGGPRGEAVRSRKDGEGHGVHDSGVRLIGYAQLRCGVGVQPFCGDLIFVVFYKQHADVQSKGGSIWKTLGARDTLHDPLENSRSKQLFLALIR